MKVSRENQITLPIEEVDDSEVIEYNDDICFVTDSYPTESTRLITSLETGEVFEIEVGTIVIHHPDARVVL